jgi:TonB family protein
VIRRARRSGLLAGLATALLATTSAFAQDKGSEPQDQSPTQSVPRGPGGAIIKPPDDKTPPPAPGQPTMPRPLNYTPPVFPPEAEKQGLEGQVVLEIDVDKTGKATRVVVKEGAGHGFDEAALAAGQKLEFEPARMPDGKPFAARIQYRYSFTQKKPDPVVQQAPKDSTVSLRGTVVLVDGDLPIIGASATLLPLEGTGSSASGSSNDKGSFTFDKLPVGKYQLTIKAPGYEPLVVTEDLKDAGSLEITYRLVPTNSVDIVVRGARPPREVTKRTLEQREISRIPGTNGDALRSIQSLPGVARPPGLAGLLIVRGSAPQDTQTFIDGTPVPLIYHFGGLSSVVPTEMLEKIDFYPGNFSTQYGRVMGGIVDASLRAPKDDGKYHGLGQVDLIDARAMLEGPVPLLKGWTFAAAGRRSYVDVWLGPVLTAAGAGVTQAPVYYDYQFLAQTNPTPSSNFRLGFFGSDDALSLLVKTPAPGEPALAGSVGLHTAFERLQARFEADPTPNDKLRVVAALGKDNIDFGLASFYFLLSIYTLTGRAELSHKIAKGATLNVGADMFSGSYSVAVRGPAPPRPGEPPNQPFSTRAVQESSTTGTAFLPGLYAELELSPASHWKIVPGVRFDYSNYTSRVDISPRVNARYELIPEYPKTTLKGGLGVFHQPPQFQEALPPFGSPGLASNRAIHYELGVEQDLNRHVELSVDGFYKQLDSLVIGQPSTSGSASNFANTGRGYVVGSEVLLKYKPDERFFGWVAYTLSRSARTDLPGQDEHLIQYDQTHILTVLGSYQLGHGWEFGARFRLVSGNLVTPNVCDQSSQDCDPLRTNSLFHAPSGVYTPIPYSGTFTERLPLFHQLDLRIDKRWKFKSWQLSAYLDVQNAYNHGNAEAIQYNYNYTGRQYVSGLPILPSIGLRGEF